MHQATALNDETVKHLPVMRRVSGQRRGQPPSAAGEGRAPGDQTGGEREDTRSLTDRR